jgi:SAM-dependent methyltransferase
MMLSPLSLARRVLATYRRRVKPIESRVLPRLHGPPQPLVYKTQSLEEYKVGALAVAERNSRWLRKTWFRDEAWPSHVRGHCFVCGQMTSFVVDFSVCSDWEGRPVPWWPNTLSCQGCRLVARMRATLQLFEEYVSPAPDDEIYITEQTTLLYQQFVKRHPHLVGSEYLVDSTPKGTTNASGIRCEDLTDLTFPDARFDYVLSFEVLEHIPDYKAAIRECARVLKPGGKLICTAPFHGDERHTIRARVTADGAIEHLLPPEYHGDPVNPDGVLCFTYFGVELLDDLKDAGFTDASAWIYWSAELGYLGEDRVAFVATR